ncbi:MAG: NUDIX domain-containing protein [Thalassococcus sp.]|uniref:NUDIX domain-containing protein n=1 Tax=Thalassococcus sp. TaxID=1928858 RepID=UPI001B05CCDE|nr:NUDIX domain-containing protein [Thalassococcus sp.]MBO6867995.1 NUDIX domain-containing protein [Thalassococcus sp.]
MIAGTERDSGLLNRFVRRILHSYFFLTRGLTIGVRAIVRSTDGRFLLVRHTYTAGWHLPGGGVEKGQASETALYNELLQETGLRLLGRPSLHGIYHNDSTSQRDHVIVYVCSVEGEPTKKPSSLEISEVGFFSIDDLPDDTDRGTIARLREISEGIMPARNW